MSTIKKYNANVVAYRLTAKKNWIKDFIWKLISKLSFLNTFQVYKSFGTKTFICPNPDETDAGKIKLKILFSSFFIKSQAGLSLNKPILWIAHN